MSQADIEYAWAQTLKLEKLGIVQHDPELHERMEVLLGTEAKKAGRPRIYQTEAEKKKAYRQRLAKKVTDAQTAQNLGSPSI